jgi:hypothetical protein
MLLMTQKLASNNRARLHLDMFKRCSRCEDKQLPCSRPEFKLKPVSNDIGVRKNEEYELAIASHVSVFLRFVSMPARHTYQPWTPIPVKGYGYHVPKAHAQAVIDSLVEGWGRAHVPTSDDDFVI